MSNIEILSIVLELITCFGVIIALFSFILSRKSIYAEYERNKKLSTIDMLKEYQSKFHDYNHILYKKFEDNPLSYNIIINNAEIERVIRDYLNDLEFICTGINIGAYDIYTMDRVFGDVLIRKFYQLYPYVEERRRQSDSQIVYVEFEKVVREIEKMHNKDVLNKKANIKYHLFRN